METIKQTVNSVLETSGLKEAEASAPAKPVREPEDWLRADQVEEIKPDEDEKS